MQEPEHHARVLLAMLGDVSGHSDHQVTTVQIWPPWHTLHSIEQIHKTTSAGEDGSRTSSLLSGHHSHSTRRNTKFPTPVGTKVASGRWHLQASFLVLVRQWPAQSPLGTAAAAPPTCSPQRKPAPLAWPEAGRQLLCLHGSARLAPARAETLCTTQVALVHHGTLLPPAPRDETPKFPCCCHTCQMCNQPSPSPVPGQSLCPPALPTEAERIPSCSVPECALGLHIPWEEGAQYGPM